MNTIKIVYGIHSATMLLDTAPERIANLYVQENRDDRRVQALIEKATYFGIKIIRVPRCELNTFISRKHQGIIVEYTTIRNLDEGNLLKFLKNRKTPALLLILDGVKDPHNLGACFRSANAFGVQVIIAPKDSAVGITPVVSRVACGAAEVTPFIPVTNLSRTIEWLKKEGVWIVGTTTDAKSQIQDIDLSNDVAIVFGSEGRGMRRLTRERCDFLARIPLYGSVDSLNVSVACGICLYEIWRQRQ